MLTVDNRCTMPSCAHGKTIYRMVGHCTNCGAQDVLVLLSGGHSVGSWQPECPVCGCEGYNGGIHLDRLATEDEIPAA